MKRKLQIATALMFSLFFSQNISAQEPSSPFLTKDIEKIEESGKLIILDSVVIKKRCKDAVELNIQIDIPAEKNLTLYQFNEFVNDEMIIVQHPNKDYGVYDAVTELNWSPGNLGLFYVIEDNDGKQIKAGFSDMLVSYVDENNKGYYHNVVDKKRMKVRSEWIEDSYRMQEYEMAKIIVPADGISMKVYPMIVKRLKRGHYKLYLCYSEREDTIYKRLDANRDENDTVYHGVLLSNKIDLIVK